MHPKKLITKPQGNDTRFCYTASSLEQLLREKLNALHPLKISKIKKKSELLYQYVFLYYFLCVSLLQE